jgi:hypothetical protein
MQKSKSAAAKPGKTAPVPRGKSTITKTRIDFDALAAQSHAEFEEWKKAFPKWEKTHPFVDRHNWKQFRDILVPPGFPQLIAKWWSGTDWGCDTPPTEALFSDRAGRKFLLLQRGKFREVSVGWALGWLERCECAHEHAGEFESGYDDVIPRVLLHEAHRVLTRFEKGAQ